MTRLLRAWVFLVAASALTTALAATAPQMFWVIPVLFALALVKSRVILARYLELETAPRILTGFMAGLYLWTAVALGMAILA